MKCISQVSREILLVCMRTLCNLAFFVYAASTEIQCLHSKQRAVIVSTELGGRQSPEIGPSWNNIKCNNNSEQKGVLFIVDTMKQILLSLSLRNCTLLQASGINNGGKLSPFWHNCSKVEKWSHRH